MKSIIYLLTITLRTQLTLIVVTQWSVGMLEQFTTSSLSLSGENTGSREEDLAVVADDLQALEAALNSAVNEKRFADAEEYVSRFDSLLLRERGVTTKNSPDEILLALVSASDHKAPVEILTDISLVSGALYAVALNALLGDENFSVSKLCFTATRDFLQLAASQTGFNLELRQRLSRAAYHIGLSAFWNGEFEEARDIFERFLSLPAFQQELMTLEDRRVAIHWSAEDNIKFDTHDVSSDVVSGVLFYLAQIYMKSGDFRNAMLFLRAVAVISGNPISAGFVGLAENKLAECYQGLIRKNVLGDSAGWSSAKCLSFSFHNRQSFSIKNVFKGSAKSAIKSISAVVPVYSGAKHIAQTLSSIAEQKLQPNELVVIDDGSQDDSLEVISKVLRQQRFAFDVIVIKTENGGQSRARNIGAWVATSSLIAFLDQDDIWYPQHLEKLLEPFVENGNLGWTYSDLDEIDLNGKMMHRRFLDLVAPNRRFFSVRDLIETDMFILPSASLISRTALIAVKGFEEDLSGYEDDDLFLRLFREGFEHEFVDLSLSQWRIHTGSCSYQMRMVLSRRKFQKKLTMMFPDEPAMGRFWIRDYISPRFFANGSNRFNVAVETGDHAMCAEALADMKTSMKTMVVPIRTRLRVLMCHFPILYKRFKTFKTHSRYR